MHKILMVLEPQTLCDVFFEFLVRQTSDSSGEFVVLFIGDDEK